MLKQPVLHQDEQHSSVCSEEYNDQGEVILGSGPISGCMVEQFSISEHKCVATTKVGQAA